MNDVTAVSFKAPTRAQFSHLFYQNLIVVHEIIYLLLFLMLYLVYTVTYPSILASASKRVWLCQKRYRDGDRGEGEHFIGE